MADISIREAEGGVTFAVKVQPRARRNAVAGTVGDALKISITAVAEDGRANRACIAFLAASLKVAASAVSILAGHGNRRKVVRIAGISAEELRDRLLALG